MTRIIRQTLWNAQVAQSGHYDTINVENLEVTVNAGTDVWGRKKKQRAFISITVTLGQVFASASATDTVDQSTIHYGTLCKAIQARLQQQDSEWMCTARLSKSIADSIREVAGSTPIYAIKTDVRYLKGSMFGDGAGHVSSIIEHESIQSSTLYLRNVCVPCLIGVNANERLRKQPVVVNMWVDSIPDSRLDDYAELENIVVNVSLLPLRKFEATLTCPRRSLQPSTRLLKACSAM